MVVTDADDIVGYFFVGMGRLQGSHNSFFNPEREYDLNLRFTLHVLLANVSNIRVCPFARQKSSRSVDVKAAFTVVTNVTPSSPENSIPDLLSLGNRCESEKLF